MYTRQIVRRLDRIRNTCLEIAVLLAKQEAHVKNRIAAHKAHLTMAKRTRLCIKVTDKPVDWKQLHRDLACAPGLKVAISKAGKK